MKPNIASMCIRFRTGHSRANGFNDTIDQTRVSDMVIVGAGSAGLAATVHGASEGLGHLAVMAIISSLGDRRRPAIG